MIQDRLKGGSTNFTWLDDEETRPDAVIRGMETHSWVHLACHAYQSRSDPRKSALQLKGGELTLEHIARKPLEHAEFAFLSACQTATGDERLPDEAVHLAAGMLFAGYRTVIGTMWAIKDSHAPLVADEVYSRLIDPNFRSLDCTNAAYALHRAVGVLRETVGVKELQTWVPFIHLGA
jgi:CHAT domain-containing protein